MPGEKSRAEGRSEEMMAAALDLFARHDVSSVTIKDIAKALRINTALIYYYFDSKAQLGYIYELGNGGPISPATKSYP